MCLFIILYIGNLYTKLLVYSKYLLQLFSSFRSRFLVKNKSVDLDPESILSHSVLCQASLALALSLSPELEFAHLWYQCLHLTSATYVSLGREPCLRAYSVGIPTKSKVIGLNRVHQMLI